MEQEASNVTPSRRLRSIQILSSINVYGLFFGIGLAIANISRLFPYGGAIYAVGVISAIGLSLLKADSEAVASRRASVDAQKLIILAISISAIAFWDALVQFLFQPIFLGFWIIPLWQCLVYGIGSLMMLIGILSATKDAN
ncbi:MAG TPA: hypothetical protein VE944_21060 [Nostoc sp.]|uniref:hypothetical protein n=1 Tax=Nostoc sp. TaxID=1180 RepID=UPI002D6D51CE|nr:hypothetical protein [Nostoc sp.]HYX16790.1 hypothetical protein [Nostoc sp.]